MLNRAELEHQGLLNDLTQSVYDPQFTRLLAKVPWQEWFEAPNPLYCREEYLEFYKQWIASTRLNQVAGLERFQRQDLINGTTQSFDEAYHRHAHRRLRIFRGEYAYHKRICTNFVFIEDESLSEKDFVILSAPFCSSGKIHPEMQMVLDQAWRLKVPVLVDAAYFGLCYGLSFDFSHPAIESVSFSLTKGLGLGHIRSGIRFSNHQDNFPICQQNNRNHTVLAAAQIGLYMMQNLSPDFIPNKYAPVQKRLCAQLGLEPSPCVHLALGDETWDQYCIDKKYRRVGLSALIKAHRRGDLELS